MKPLPRCVKVFIVQRLAMFDAPSEVVRAVAAEFPGMLVSTSRVQCYDPGKYSGRTLSTELRALFHNTRREFVRNLDGQAMAHKATRLHRLEAIHAEAREAKNHKAALGALEGARREMAEMDFVDDHDVDDDAQHDTPTPTPVQSS